MLDEIKKFIELQIHELSIVYIYSDEEYRIYNNVLYINPNSTDVIDIIKRNIPNAITKLSLHANFINTNLDIFDKLTNLSELTCNAGYLTIESWEHLKNNTNIRKINLNNCSITKDSVPSEINAIITKCKMIGDFKGIEISDDYTHKENEEIPYIYIYIGNDNQKFINNFYNYILSQGSRICTKAWSFIEFYNSLNNSLRTRYANKELICIVENDDDILFIESCLKYIDVFNLPLENIQLKINNQNYNNIKILKKLDNKYKLTFYYKNMLGTDNLNLFKTNTTCNLHEFLEMRETINYYKDLILSYNLSPIEKIMFAYDLVKSFPYHESDTNVNYSRMIYSIIKTGDIVCVGYSNFLAQILMELGFNSYAIGTKLHDLNGNSGGHERNVVYVEDDKYNIHGWYAFDATGDSSRIIPYRKKTETGSEVVNSSPISQYTYFLVPLSEYERYFIGENIPDLTDSTNKPFFASQPNFDNYGKSETISPDTIDQIIYNVRLAEGFKSDEAAYAVKEARHITNAIIKQLFADSIKYQEINSAKK